MSWSRVGASSSGGSQISCAGRPWPRIRETSMFRLEICSPSSPCSSGSSAAWVGSGTRSIGRKSTWCAVKGRALTSISPPATPAWVTSRWEPPPT
ncbi:Uncharacterised protein [Mycobacteroides abscessus subsp. abscessus]|nr:Uncharacterised protein [Mycobacteroides abscessus subsp. abscessus]